MCDRMVIQWNSKMDKYSLLCINWNKPFLINCYGVSLSFVLSHVTILLIGCIRQYGFLFGRVHWLNSYSSALVLSCKCSNITWDVYYFISRFRTLFSSIPVSTMALRCAQYIRLFQLRLLCHSISNTSNFILSCLKFYSSQYLLNYVPTKSRINYKFQKYLRNCCFKM